MNISLRGEVVYANGGDEKLHGHLLALAELANLQDQY